MNPITLERIEKIEEAFNYEYALTTAEMMDLIPNFHPFPITDHLDTIGHESKYGADFYWESSEVLEFEIIEHAAEDQECSIRVVGQISMTPEQYDSGEWPECEPKWRIEDLEFF